MVLLVFVVVVVVTNTACMPDGSGFLPGLGVTEPVYHVSRNPTVCPFSLTSVAICSAARWRQLKETGEETLK